jgi:D-serine deaminase-like pyridoxal phosphate-dependent protein
VAVQATTRDSVAEPRTADRAIPVPSIPGGLETPAVWVDLDVVEANIGRLQRLADERGIALRPHAKTHKSVRVADLQRAAGAAGLTVGTLGEAEVFAEAGFEDLFLAYPVWTGGAKAQRLRRLLDRIDLRVGVDSAEGIDSLAAAVHGASRPLRVLVEVDSGGHRTGVEPSSAGKLAARSERAGLEVVGIFTHGGHAYAGPSAVEGAADDEVAALSAAAEALRREGIEPRVLSAGSTPTVRGSARPPVTEERPGTYVYNDRIQVLLGSCQPDQVALFVAATVVSTSVPGQFVLDAGAKALGRDAAVGAPGLGGYLPAWPDALIARLNDYHAVVSVPPGSSRPSVGEVVAIVPNHVCPVVDLHAEFVVCRDSEPLERWPVDARGRSG